MDPPLVLVIHTSDEGQLGLAVTQSKGRTGGYRVGDAYRWALLNSYPQLLFDFEQSLHSNHRPSMFVPQPKQTICGFT